MNLGPYGSQSTVVDSSANYSWCDTKTAMLVRNFSTSGGLELYAYKLTEGLLELGLSITVICEEVHVNLTHAQLNVVQIAHCKPNMSKTEQMRHRFEQFSAALNKYGPFDIVHSQHLGAAPVDVVTFHNHTVFRIEKCGLPIEAEINKFKLLFRSDYILRQQMDARLIQDAKVLIFPSKICKQDYIEHYQLDERREPTSLVVAYPGWQMPDLAADKADKTNGSGINSAAIEATIIPVDLNVASDKERTIIFVGRGFRKKGLDVLLSACRLLKRKNCAFHLLIAGLKERPLDKLRLWLLGLSNHISYLGVCRNMEKVYDAGSIIVQPSRMEPFGMSVLQAMSCGLVPVLSKVCGAAELMSPDQDALILENHLDAEELSEKLAFLLNNPIQMRALSQEARIKAKTIDWRSTVETTLGAYKQVFQKKYII